MKIPKPVGIISQTEFKYLPNQVISNCHTETIDTQTIDTQTIGTQTIDTQTIGTKTIGTETINTKTIIGIDPGLQNLGIGIIQINPDIMIIPQLAKKKKLIYNFQDRLNCIVAYKCISLKIKTARKIDKKLNFIFDTLCNIFQTHNPFTVIIEDSFVGINKNSALKLGMVRGCILTAIGKHVDNFMQIPPSQIKLEIAKIGNAEKTEIYSIFSNSLPEWDESITLDASDALAAAICGIR